MEKKNIFTVSDFVSETNPDPPWSLSFYCLLMLQGGFRVSFTDKQQLDLFRKSPYAIFFRESNPESLFQYQNGIKIKPGEKEFVKK